MYIDFITKSFQLQLQNQDTQIGKKHKCKNYKEFSQKIQQTKQESLPLDANNVQEDYIEKIILINKSHIALISNHFIEIANFQTGQFLSRINCNYFWQIFKQKHGLQEQQKILSYFEECYYSNMTKKFVAVIFFNGSRYLVSFNLNIDVVDIKQSKEKKNNQCEGQNNGWEVQIENISVLYSFKEFPVKYGLELQPKIIGFSETGTIVLVRKFYSDSLLVVFKYNQIQKTHKNHWSFSINQECISNLDQTKYLVNYRQLIQKNYLQIQIIDIQQKQIRNLRIQQHIEPCTIYGILRPTQNTNISIEQNFKNLTIVILMNIRKCKRSSILKYNTSLQIVEEYTQFENEQFQDIFRINKQFLLLTKNFWNSQEEYDPPESKIQIISGDSNFSKEVMNNVNNNDKDRIRFLFKYNSMREEFISQPTLGTFLSYYYNVKQKIIEIDSFKMFAKKQAYCYILNQLRYQIENQNTNREQDATNINIQLLLQKRQRFKMSENQQIFKQIYELL